MYLRCFFLFLCINISELSHPGLEWEAEKEVRIEAIRRGILEQLGLTEPPCVEKKVSRAEEDRVYSTYLQQIRQRTRNTYRDHSDKDRRGNHIFLVKGTIFEDKNQKQRKGKNTQRFIFDLDVQRHKGFRVKRALLTLAIRQKGRRRFNAVLRIEVYQVLKASLKGRDPHRLFVTAKVSRPQKAVYTEKFDIEQAIKLCLAHPKDNCSLEVVFSHDIIKDPVGPKLKLEGYTAIKRSRARRHATPDDCNTNQRQCCRKTMQVSFEEIGWADWIRAPKGYNAYYCDGTCPPKYKTVNAYTEIKSKMHRLSNGIIPGPCCVPMAYEPLTIMHLNSEGKLTISTLEDIIASSCNCA
ncbi:inhibin beta C chain-like [Lepisosteus oculatus]|uniref:inhibin beta C chain-like n=1 Tax=Lepisosteus oculatus TaxID=7918 RepID=UPI00371A7F92